VISANVSGSRIRHSQYAALVLKDAIVDSFRDACGDRPSVARIDADIRFNLHIADNRATIYLDASGGSLHRRGYRREAVDAPMQETLAAAVIRLSSWDGDAPLYDPMCGSGTLLMRGTHALLRGPGGLLRRSFGFTWLPDFDSGAGTG
jgi:putative N6-adenine-specific DNA methylase